MDSFSIWHWFVGLLFVVLPVWFGWRTVSKAGMPGAWALLVLVPLLNLIMLWIFAFAKWPRYPDR